MRKIEELTNPNSCLFKARPDEMMFVLLGRDAAAPKAVRAWVRYRIDSGKNCIDDAQVREALACADAMEAEQRAGMA